VQATPRVHAPPKEVSTVHRRRHVARPSGFLTAFSVIGALVALTLLGSFGSGTVRAEEPSPEVSFAASDGPPPPSPPSPTEPPTDVACDGGDTAGELPAGDQAITGRVTNALGEGVADLEVRIGTGQYKSWSVSTNADGQYVIESLGDASYLISFFDQAGTYKSGFYAGSATPALTPAGATAVPLSGSGAAGIDAVLANESLHTVSGLVTQFGGAGLSGAFVTLVPLYFPPPACSETLTNGTYTVANIRTGAYRLQVSHDGFPTGMYRDGATGNFTSRYSEATALTIDSDLSGINVAYPELFSLTGTVRDAGDSPTGGFYIGASETPDGASGSAFSESGEFTIEGLPAGQYLVNYDDSNQEHVSGWYAGDGVISPTRDGAVAVTVPGGAIQLLAVSAPVVSGTITPLDTPEDSVYVSLCNDSEDQSCFGGYVATDGTYGVSVLVPGTYVASVSDYSGTYPSGWIAPDGSITRDLGAARQITVADADVPDVDATLPDGGRVHVTVTSAGQPAPYAFVQFCLAEEVCPDAVGTDEFGEGMSTAMFPDTYYALVTLDWESFSWYVADGPATSSFSAASPINVTALFTEPIVIDVSPSTPGTPTDAGEGVQPVEVVLDDGTGNTPVSVTFSDVESSGTTTLTTSETSDYPLPSGFQLGLPATYYDITTDAAVLFPAVVCISYADDVIYMDEANLRLFHHDGTAWEDITVPPVDTVNNLICGSTNSLSPFVLGERVPQFTGYFQPVDNGTLNRAKAGAGVPVKFSLGGDFGLDIFAVGYPAVSPIGCIAGATVDPIEQTINVGSSSLEYDASTDRYVYRFKTSKSWAGTCQRLTMEFSDGTVQTADFKFTK
jgi:hypothetical protein